MAVAKPVTADAAAEAEPSEARIRRTIRTVDTMALSANRQRALSASLGGEEKHISSRNGGESQPSSTQANITDAPRNGRGDGVYFFAS